MTEIQVDILSNKNYLAIDNFKNSAYFATCGLVEIMVEFMGVGGKRGNGVEGIIQKWIDKLSTLNLEDAELEVFYVTIFNTLTKKYTTTS